MLDVADDSEQDLGLASAVSALQCPPPAAPGDAVRPPNRHSRGMAVGVVGKVEDYFRKAARVAVGRNG